MTLHVSYNGFTDNNNYDEKTSKKCWYFLLWSKMVLNVWSLLRKMWEWNVFKRKYRLFQNKQGSPTQKYQQKLARLCVERRTWDWRASLISFIPMNMMCIGRWLVNQKDKINSQEKIHWKAFMLLRLKCIWKYKQNF